MKKILTSIAAGSLLATLAIAQSTHYKVHDLGLSGSPLGGPLVIKNNGLIVGTALVSGGADHAVFWYRETGPGDIGTLGGPNSIGTGINGRGQIVGSAETLTQDNEDFCGFKMAGLPSLGTSCLPFMWQTGVMTPLPTLGGNNGFAAAINNRGEVVGVAETNTPDPHPDCPVHQFKPVVWRNGKVQQLELLPSADDLNGDPYNINDHGQVVGASGDCSAFNPVNGGTYLQPHHALLWEKDGAVIDLGNLGGTGQPPALGNWAITINNRGDIVGTSDVGDGTNHAFLWTQETGKMQDLGTLEGDVDSGAVWINDEGDIVGISVDVTGNSRAFVRQNGVLVDLNDLVVSGGPPLYLLNAESINAHGEIIGLAFDTSDNQAHGFLAVPVHGTASESAEPARQDVTRPTVLPENVRGLLRMRFPIRER